MRKRVLELHCARHVTRLELHELEMSDTSVAVDEDTRVRSLEKDLVQESREEIAVDDQDSGRGGDRRKSRGRVEQRLRGQQRPNPI
jgi:hypothetical protein